MRRVYAFFRVIDDIVDEETDPKVKKDLIDSWKRELEKTYRGLTIVPLLAELKETIERFAIPHDYFLKLIEGCEMDMTKTRYQTFEELYEYCYRVASMVGLVCMKIFEYRSDTSDQMAIDLGLALQLTNIIRDVGVDFQKGRIYLPQEDLDRFHVSYQDLQDNKPNPAFLELMEFEYQRALTYYQKASPEFGKDKEGKLLAAKIMATVYGKILHKIKKKKYPVKTKRVRLGFGEKMFILLKILGQHYLR